VYGWKGNVALGIEVMCLENVIVEEEIPPGCDGPVGRGSGQHEDEIAEKVESDRGSG
jgi:hypothetical protein